MKKVLVLLFLLSLGASSRADKWAAPSPIVLYSSDATILIKMVPGSVNALFGESETEISAPVAIIYTLDGESYTELNRFSLPSIVIPVSAVFTGNKKIVLFDHWHQMGMKEIVFVLSIKGVIEKSWTLDDLYSKKEQARFIRSASSIYWRKDKLSEDWGDGQVSFYDCLGNYVTIDSENLMVNKQKLRGEEVCE